MLRVLSGDDVETVLDLAELLEAVERGLIAQFEGRVERPDRPHYPIGRGLRGEPPLGTGLVMPAYVHGSETAATKLVGVFEGNAERGLPTIHAQILLTDAGTGEPRVLMDGTTVTNARTGCIGGVSARALTEGPIALGVLGAGAQARWQTRAIGTACPVERVAIYSPSDSRHGCAEDLRDDGFDAVAVDSSTAAVTDADVVVTATTSAEPVFPADALAEGAIVIAIGAYTADMQELEAAVLEGAATVFADVPAEVATIGDLLATELTEDELVPLGALLAGASSPPPVGEPVVVESVGSAVLDAVAAGMVYDRAAATDLGRTVPF